jgi:hypothetical protein
MKKSYRKISAKQSPLSLLSNSPVDACDRWSMYGAGGGHAPVAQWIEHQTSNLGVAGSSPARGTTIFTNRCRQYVRVV